MPWVSVEKKVIGMVELKEEGVPPRPPTPPTPDVLSFIEEHRKLKAIIDRHGKNGLCVSRTTLESEGNVMGDRMDQHLNIFVAHDALGSITEEGWCGKSALKKLKEKLMLEL